MAPLQCLRHGQSTLRPESQEAWTQESSEHFEAWVTPAWKRAEWLGGAAEEWEKMQAGVRGRVSHTTCGEVLYNAGSCGVENDVGAIIKVMQVVPAVKASVAKHVVQSQLLRAHTQSTLRGRQHIV